MLLHNESRRMTYLACMTSIICYLKYSILNYYLDLLYHAWYGDYLSLSNKLKLNFLFQIHSRLKFTINETYSVAVITKRFFKSSFLTCPDFTYTSSASCNNKRIEAAIIRVVASSTCSTIVDCTITSDRLITHCQYWSNWSFSPFVPFVIYSPSLASNIADRKATITFTGNNLCYKTPWN